MITRLGLISAYSLLYGIHEAEKLLDRAQSFGTTTVSVCDLNNLYGVHSFIEAAKERNIRPIIGSLITTNKCGNHVYCFVQNREGFARLCEILSIRNADEEHFDPLPLLQENAAGLVLASSDGQVLESLANRVKHLFAAITPNDTRAIGPDKRLNIPLAFLDDSLFLEPEDFSVHRVLRAIALLKTTGNLQPKDTAAANRVMRSSEELLRRLASWPEALKGTETIASLCTLDSLFNGWVFPAYAPELCHAMTDQITEGYNTTAHAELRRRVYQGNAGRYGALREREKERIDYELKIIEEKGFAPYFLVIDDIVAMASRTCGRGSGAASIVSYGLGITNVDPIRYDLYFERFLNPSRPDPPDLDIDFAWDERDALIKAVINKFGSDHCARVANHNMFRYRSAMRETAKTYGFGDAEITLMERKLQVANNIEQVLEDPLWREIFAIAEKIEGLPRGLGMHCGGIVITPEPICRYVPVEKSAEGYPLMAWEKEGAEAAGFVKIDLLGNRSLAVIRDAVTQITANSGTDITDRLNRSVDDRETIEALARGDSMGVFYIESPAMRQLQKKTGRGDFDHIVIHSSIIRPAANRFIAEYVRRLKGGTWQPLHPLLENILHETYGILCYQEDVSKTAVALAGFNEADADKLRKVIAKKMGGKRLAVYQNQFYEGCRKNNVADDIIRKIWEMMLSFDGYSFCKPHSASYAMVSFQSAYLRVHHPAEFMAAVLSNQGGFYLPHAYIAEARRMQLKTAGPDINISQWHYYGINGTLVIGLMAIKGLSVSGVQTLIKERECSGDFISLDDFSHRVRLNRDDIIALCPAGVFDSIAQGISRPLQARQLLKIRNEELVVRNNELFAAEPSPVHGIIAKTFNVPVEKRLHTSNADLWGEYQALGFLRNLHPLALWKNKVLAIQHRVKAIEIGHYVGRPVKMIGWPVTQKDVWTRDGLTMCFLSLEDETGLYETVVFPKVYDRYNKLLFDQQPLLVYGRVANDEGALSVEINRIETLILDDITQRREERKGF